MTTDPDYFFINSNHDGEMELSCPSCPHWSTPVPNGASIEWLRQVACVHLDLTHPGEQP